MLARQEKERGRTKSDLRSRGPERDRMRIRPGFTLIELLVVTDSIAI